MSTKHSARVINENSYTQLESCSIILGNKQEHFLFRWRPEVKKSNGVTVNITRLVTFSLETREIQMIYTWLFFCKHNCLLCLCEHCNQKTSLELYYFLEDVFIQSINVGWDAAVTEYSRIPLSWHSMVRKTPNGPASL